LFWSLFCFFAFVLLFAAENNWCAFICILLAGNKIQLVDLAFFFFFVFVFDTLSKLLDRYYGVWTGDA
jgi:hypothetical protein